MTEIGNFPRQFAAAFGAQDAEGLAALFATDGCFHGLTGHFFEGREAIATGLAEEFAGLSRAARLVTGKQAQTRIGPGAAILHQRFVVTGLRAADGSDLPRVGALLTAVLAARDSGWQALTASFSVLES